VVDPRIDVESGNMYNMPCMSHMTIMSNDVQCLWMDGFTNMVLEPDFSSISCV